MWQQLDCNIGHATSGNPSGCNGHLFSWVETTIGAGDNGIKQPANFSTECSPTAISNGEGSTALGFYNVQSGDAPYFKNLADEYAMSDNFHQSVNGGTGANYIMLGHADAIYFSDGNGHAAAPPLNVLVQAGGANAGVVDEVENPNPAPGTNNWYTEEGYGDGSYSNCADPGQPGSSVGAHPGHRQPLSGHQGWKVPASPSSSPVVSSTATPTLPSSTSLKASPKKIVDVVKANPEPRKNTAIGTRKSGAELVDLQFRSEFFNLFNIVNMGLPANVVDGSGFGEISKTAGTSRQIQFSLKLIY